MRVHGSAFAVAVVLASAGVWAQPAADKRRASELVKHAIARSQAGDHQSAVKDYLAAYELVPTPLLLSNLGAEYQQLNAPAEARTYFCKYLAADPGGTMAAYATEQARQLYVALGGVEDVADSDVCKPVVARARPAPPPEREPVAPEPVAPAPPAPAPRGRLRTLGYVGVGLGVVGVGLVGLGVYYGLEASRISDAISNHDPSVPWPADIRDQEQAGRRYEALQVASLVGGGVTVAAGVTLLLLDRSRARDDASITLAPVTSNRLLGLAASGRF